MNKLWRYILFFVCCYFCTNPQHVHAACAKVSIEILQELTIERVAFDAKLLLTNGMTDQSLENMRVDVIITDKDGNMKNDLFFIRPPALTGIGGTLDGSGTVGASAKGEAHWLIIPSPGAGYILMDGAIKQIGVDYWVGATLTYSIGTNTETVPINPAKITVKPMPQLVLDYFMPFNVLGDNPFTPQVEPPVPYPLAVRVMNDGYGAAMKLRIDSAQPKIIDNKQGLLIDFRILGTAMNDSSVTPSLIVDFGDLASKKGATASWQMISTLSGKFVDFKTSFTHASELGGDLTSLIKATNPHYLTHMVKVNLPGRDNRLDFLADINANTGVIYESEIPNGSVALSGSQSPVTVILPLAVPTRPTPQTPNVSLTLPLGATGWIYTKMEDPSQGLLKLLDVVRSDGVRLDSNNFWVEQGLNADYKKTWTLQFIDYRTESTPGSYTLKFTTPAVDVTPPATDLIFDGPATGTNPVFLTPQTRLLLTATDNEGGSGVDGMFKKVAGVDADFTPAYPFNLTTAGSHTISYYSVDLSGNTEAAKSASIVVVDTAPAITSYAVTPASFTPLAPKGVAGARSVDFNVTATSGVATFPVEIAIATGATFQANQLVRTLKGTASSGSELRLSWDGKDSSGKFVPTGTYTAQVKIADGLDNPADLNAPSHTVTATAVVTVAEWFVAQPIDPNPAADQLHPRISGSRVVWQDLRNGKWDIYTKNLTGGAATLIPSVSADRQHPAVDGNVVVWQDGRNGNGDIYGYDLSSSTELVVSIASGDQADPVISGNWVAWQDNRDGNWDIFAYNISTLETVRITSHERDQLHPVLSGTTVTWEDYRHGFGEIYQYDLVTRTETQVSSGPADQTLPARSGASLVWTDRRTGQSDIFTADPTRGARRLTYGTGDHSQAAVLNDLLVFTDYENGADDPNISFRLLSNGVGERLMTNTARQEEPAIGTNLLVWQDNRDGKFQIYAAPLTTETTDIEVPIKPGFNLVAVGTRLATQYPTATAFINAPGNDFGIDRLLLHDAQLNSFTEAAVSGGNFNLTKGTGLVIYARSAGTLKLADSGEMATYTLLPGTNQIGVLTVPSGYTASSLVKSVGLDNIQSVRRFDNTSGSWQTIALRGTELLGQDFAIQPGDGLVLTMKNRVDGWQP
jgi:beta propeller repeat protein